MPKRPATPLQLCRPCGILRQTFDSGRSEAQAPFLAGSPDCACHLPTLLARAALGVLKVAAQYCNLIMQKIWPKMRNLRWLHSHAAGLDGILFPELVDSSIILTNGKVSDCQHWAPVC